MKMISKRSLAVFGLALSAMSVLADIAEAGPLGRRDRSGSQRMTLRERREARRNETPEERNERRARFWGAVAQGLSNSASSSSFNSWSSSTSTMPYSGSPSLNYQQLDRASFNLNYSTNPDHASVYGN